MTPYDTYTGVAHALCNAHLLRELIYVQDTAPKKVADLAEQATDALLTIKDLVEAAAASGTGGDVEVLAHHTGLLRSAVVLGKTATRGRATKLERKYNALFARVIGRWADYLRFTSDPLVPFDNNGAEQTIRMPKLRVKVSGCLRSLAGAQDFAAIRSYIATALRGGQNMLDVLVQAVAGTPWVPASTGIPIPRVHPPLRALRPAPNKPTAETYPVTQEVAISLTFMRRVLV
jgi:hypothetical protein